MIAIKAPLDPLYFFDIASARRSVKISLSSVLLACGSNAKLVSQHSKFFEHTFGKISFVARYGRHRSGTDARVRRQRHAISAPPTAI
jgi:hypothetical protein